MIMKAKYKRGKMIKSVSDFEKSTATWYRVRFGNEERTRHRGFLISWQYQLLERFIKNGSIFEAIPTDEYDGIHQMKKEGVKQC